jgi:hypothetical protein
MTKDEALRLALDWFKCYQDKSMSRNNAEELANEAITAIKATLEAKDEPFGYFRYELRLDAWVQSRDSNQGVAFYTTQPQRKPLSDEQAMDAYFETPPFGTYKEAFIAGIRFIEATRGIKEEA